MRVAEAFQITGRGLVVAVEEVTELPVGKKLSARITTPDGTSIDAEAFKEWLLRRTPELLEKEAYLLVGLVKDDVPVGSEIHLEIAPAVTAASRNDEKSSLAPPHDRARRLRLSPADRRSRDRLRARVRA
jgi:hypothetical protein